MSIWSPDPNAVGPGTDPAPYPSASPPPIGPGGPPPTPASSTPPPAPPPTHPRRWPLVVVGAVVVLAAGVGGGFALRSGKTSPTPGTTTAAGPDFPARTDGPPSSAVRSDDVATEGPGLPATSSAPPVTVSTAGVDYGAVATTTGVSAVVAVFDTYFGGINSHRPEVATSVFDPAGTIDPGDAEQVARFGANTATTTDSAITLIAIGPYPAVGTDLLATLTFRSEQAAALGPDGETCTDWRLSYHLVPFATGGWRILRAEGVSHTACA